MPATTLASPTAAETLAALRTALDKANCGARTRRVELSEVDHWPAKIDAAPAGVLAADGGSVPNSYKYRAETTDLRVGWWTDGRGKKTVRIMACRTSASHTSYGRGNGTALPPRDAWVMTFPERATKLAEARRARVQKLLDRIGPEGADDRLAIRSIFDRTLAAAAPNGLLIADHPERPRLVQVVVRDSTTGQRHHITVPPKFATPASKTYQKLGTSAARVHAALAWTFNLKPEAYRPTVEA